MLSLMSLPLTKADWALSIIEGRTSLSRLERILDMHLYIVLQQEIVLESVIDVGLTHLGIRAIAVELNPLGILQAEKRTEPHW